jgi:hypothetical protein
MVLTTNEHAPSAWAPFVGNHSGGPQANAMLAIFRVTAGERDFHAVEFSIACVL